MKSDDGCMGFADEWMKNLPGESCHNFQQSGMYQLLILQTRSYPNYRLQVDRLMEKVVVLQVNGFGMK